jgi:hypothetical protein
MLGEDTKKLCHLVSVIYFVTDDGFKVSVCTSNLLLVGSAPATPSGYLLLFYG